MDVKNEGVLSGHVGAIYSIVKGADESFLFTASGDKHVALWNLKSMQPEKFLASFPNSLYSLAYIHEKGILLAGTTIGNIHVIDVNERKEIKVLHCASEAIFDIKYSVITNNFYIAAGDGTIGVGDLESISLKKLKKICSAKVRSIELNDNDGVLYAACGDGKVRVYELDTLESKWEWSAHASSVNIVRCAPKGNYLLTGGKDAHLNIWSKNNLTLIKSIPAHNYAIYDIVYNPEGTLFATASRDKTVKLWDALSFEVLLRINKEKYDGHINSVNKLLWPSSEKLISVSDDRKIIVWDVSNTIRNG